MWNKKKSGGVICLFLTVCLYWYYDRGFIYVVAEEMEVG